MQVHTLTFKFVRDSAVASVGEAETITENCHRFHYSVARKKPGGRLYAWEKEHKGPSEQESTARHVAEMEMKDHVHMILNGEPGWVSDE